ncbi:sulfotransferase family protein [Maritimibacter sp. 55A14]|uniref:sulfotransferase n=1 Tax=Maritimibacter sp. 55A14 TaxID=2174844 RepID=UPI000D603AC5|nr:sulfotransferase [Maritimibacter sp. 55A14]PWE32975.1 sulfotransferase family protein [Maritimibacter sp. 55A14]
MSDYSTLDRVLHRLALGVPVLPEMLHDIERAAFLKSAPPFEPGGHVFVTGLARAGTTILMRELHATGVFGSLTYADMPFVLAPNLWARLSRGGGGSELKERAHGDGIAVNEESPEALDEVYWRVVCDIDYIRPDGLRPHEPGAAAIAGYADYIRLILRRTGRARYLTKNNNTLLRLAALADAWPDAHFLVPLRDPLQHAGSLLAQHRRFLGADAFTRNYMTWLGHHEFGATHRPYLFGGGPTGNPDSLDYWLTVWLRAHEHLRDTAADRENIVILPHEEMSRDPEIWTRLMDRLGLEPRAPSEMREIAPREVPDHDAALAEEARALHRTLAEANSLERGVEVLEK